MKCKRSIVRGILAAWLLGVGTASAVHAELVVSDLVVELHPGESSRKDIELWNNSDERSYIEVTPAEILNPGRSTETRLQGADPERLGLLVSPNRIILEPGQHKVIRIAAISGPSDEERIYRVTVKPVVGEISSEHSGLKVLVGYDVLTIVRPTDPAPKINGVRDGRILLLRNDGNSSAELLDGKQCEPAGSNCVKLPGKRLYAGADFQLELGSDGPVEFQVKNGNHLTTVRY